MLGRDRRPRSRVRGQCRIQLRNLRRRRRADGADHRDGPILVLQQQFFVDSLNVFLVTLTAFVAFTTALFARPYMRIERDHGKMTPPRMRLFHSMYQMFTFTMLLGAADQQHGAVVGGDGSRDANDGVAGGASIARRRASRPHGSTSSCAASALPRRCSARSCYTSLPSA